MKKMNKLAALTLAIVSILLSSCILTTQAAAKKMEHRGVWVSCFDYETAGLKDQNATGFRINVKKMYKTILANGCNVVYFHVRSFDDAIWPSDTFAISSYMSSTGTLPYDAMAILVEEAHKVGLEFHAWMNPYRVTYDKVLDPGKKASTSRIAKAIDEILAKYPVDGIHFDDYFYPSGAHKQAKKYAKVSQPKKMSTVNTMIRQIYAQVKAVSQDIDFGISPPGEVSYANSIGGDVKTWMSEEGYVDYIIPQIYWTDNYISKGKKVKMFTDCMTNWEEMNTLDIPMYAGLALYRAKAVSAADPGWRKRSTNIANQVKQLKREGWKGYVLFSYLNLVNDTAVKERSNYRKAIQEITLSKKSLSLKTGEKKKLKVTIWPSGVGRSITYRSSNRGVATVNSKVTIQAKKIGSTKITVWNAGKKATCKVTVTE